MTVLEFFENLMHHIVEVAILVFEFIGVIVIIISGLKGFYFYLRRRPDMKLALAQGLAVIALRAALTFLIHWEIKEEKAEEKVEEKTTKE